LPKKSAVQFVHARFIIGIVVGVSWFTLTFEAIGAESRGPDFSTLSRDSRTGSPPREVTIRLPDGQNVRVGGKAGALIAGGSSALRSKQYDKAISLLTAALHTNPEKNIASYIYFDRAMAYSEKGQLDKALSDWTAAIQLNPKNAAAYYNRGNVYSWRRQYSPAIRDATTAIQLRPKFPNAYHNRGAFHANVGEFDKAIADYSEAIRFNPRSASTFANRALAYRNIEKSDKAMADYDQVIEITPKDAEDYTARGSAYFATGHYKACVSSFEKALQLSPNNDAALGGLAWVRATCPDASLRNGKEAIRMSTRACELSKWSEQDHLQTLAAAYGESGDFDKAVKYQAQAINMKGAYGPLLEEARERLAFYRDHKPWRAKPLVAG
jgi:tetratricopeptide (TPR) repeat protein